MHLPDRLYLGDETWIHVGETGFPTANTEYEPSIRDDISEMLPFATDQTENSLSENYNADSSCSQPGNHFQTGRSRCLGNLDFGTSFWILQFPRLTCSLEG